MPVQEETVIRRWFEEVWNQQREETIDELLLEDAIGHGLTDDKGNVLRGPAGFKTLFHAFIQAYPDIHVDIEETVVQDREVALCTVTGTHTGEGLGVAPTLKRIEFTGLCMIRVKDGKISEAWNQFDFMNMYQQLGVLSLTLG